MSDNPEVVRVHTDAIAELEALQDFARAGKEVVDSTDRRMVFAYVDEDDKAHALAGAKVRAVGLLPHLIVESVVVHPAELNNENSTTWIRLKHRLELLTTTIDMKLDKTPIAEDPLPVCVRISRLQEDDEIPGALRDSGAQPVQRRWTRWATRARDLAAAVVAEDYARAAQIQAEFDALTEEDHRVLNSVAAAVGAAIDDEDWETAAELKAALDAAVQKGTT
jgi:hypothetical protein